MKALVWLVAASVLLLAAGSHAEDKKDAKPDEPIKVVTEHLDKAWGIKFKSVSVKDTAPEGADTQVKLTLEFTKDITDTTEMRKAFVAATGIPLKFDGLPLVWHLFDEDNVSLGKFVITDVEGDLTGVKGDAFRVVVSCLTTKFKKAKKIEARLSNPPKPTKD